MFVQRTVVASARRAIIAHPPSVQRWPTASVRCFTTTKATCFVVTQARYDAKDLSQTKKPGQPAAHATEATSEATTTTDALANATEEVSKSASDSNPDVYVYKRLHEIKSRDDLFGPGALPGTIPTDLEQATGTERMELLAKLEGKDLWDLKKLDSSRTGTLDDPIVLQGAGEEQYLGCTGCPAESHVCVWITISRDRPIERCIECGSVYKMDYIGDPDHHEEPPEFEEPKTFADYIRPEYLYR